MREIFEGVFTEGGNFFTRNLLPGEKVYGEDLIIKDGVEYRKWDYTRSKAAAGLKKGIKNFPIMKGSRILYLGIASGTTSSHFSDIIGREGIIYGVDIAERVLRDLVPVAEKRGNIAPILGDTRKPEEYGGLVMESVDVVFEDVASDDQIPILIRNCETFLKDGGYAMISIKSQSIDVTKKPSQVYKECLDELSKHFKIIEKVELDPYEKHHLLVTVQKD